MNRRPIRNTFRSLAFGIAAGAAGTTALNLLTYLDMTVRGRPASTTPEVTVRKFADRAGIRIPGDGQTRDNRVAGLGPTMGLLAGLVTGAGAGLGRAAGLEPGLLLGGVATGAAAMIATDAPMAVLGVTDPRRWSVSDWLGDAVPHLAYGLTTAVVLHALERGH
jgi:hypothetical protein